MPNEAPAPVWKVVAVVSFYMVVALVMVMTNKWVLTTSSLPLTFLFMQCAISVLLLHILALVTSPSQPHADNYSRLPTSSSPTASPRSSSPVRASAFSFTIPHWTKSTVRSVLPVSTVNVVGLAFNIYCLKLVDASYFQVARGLTLPMTVVLQSLTMGDKPSMGTIVSCGLVTWGFTYSFIPNPLSSESTASSLTSSEAPMLGMVLGVASAAMVAIHAILIKSALGAVEGKTLDLAYWQNAISALALIPGILISGEVPAILRLFTGEEGGMEAFLIGSLVTGVVGFLICLAGLLSIKVTSPVTHMFSAAVRSVLQTFLGVWLFHDILNATRVVSTGLIILGGLLYTYIKSRPKPAPAVVSIPHNDPREPMLSRNISSAELEKQTEIERRRSDTSDLEKGERS